MPGVTFVWVGAIFRHTVIPICKDARVNVVSVGARLLKRVFAAFSLVLTCVCVSPSAVSGQGFLTYASRPMRSRLQPKAPPCRRPNKERNTAEAEISTKSEWRSDDQEKKIRAPDKPKPTQTSDKHLKKSGTMQMLLKLNFLRIFLKTNLRIVLTC